MKRALLVLSLGFAFTDGTNAQNSCATALPISAGSYQIAAVDGQWGPDCSGSGAITNTEWYSYTPIADHFVKVTTDLAINLGLDTRIHIEDGCTWGCISGSDNTVNGLLAVAYFSAEQGNTYIFALDDNNSGGGFTFEVVESPPVQQTVSFTYTPGAFFDAVPCVVDMNSDRLDDIVGAYQDSIVIRYQLQGGGFNAINIPTPSVDHPASWSIAAGDLDKNGTMDLLCAGDQGVTFLLADSNGTSFSELSFPINGLLRSSHFVDIDEDGHLDAFVCNLAGANVFFINDGFGGLTMQSGLGPVCGNLGSAWVDYDNDCDVDLFLTKDGTCDPADQLYRNDGAGTFTELAPTVGLDDPEAGVSAAWGDLDNDGDMDMTILNWSARKVMRNDGNTFVDVTAGTGYEVALIGDDETLLADLDNDGRLDVISMNSPVMVNLGNMVFHPNSIMCCGTAAVGDLNNDGYLDVLTSSGLLMNNGGTHHWLRVHTVGSASNGNGIGARVHCTSDLGTQIREVRSGEGMARMSSLITHFGLGQDTLVNEVVVCWPSGLLTVVDNPPLDTTITIYEDPLLAIKDPTQEMVLAAWPNPTVDHLVLSCTMCTTDAIVRVLDLMGKQVLGPLAFVNQLDLSGLATGVYTLRVDIDDQRFVRTFTKQ